MAGEKNLSVLLKNMTPEMQQGEFVFCTVNDEINVSVKEVILFFKEKEGTTLILEKSKADYYKLSYDSIMSWITLNIHSSLDAVGLTASFSNALAKEEISCNVVAAFYHDHIFVNKKDGEKAMNVLNKLTEQDHLNLL